MRSFRRRGLTSWVEKQSVRVFLTPLIVGIAITTLALKVSPWQEVSGFNDEHSVDAIDISEPSTERVASPFAPSNRLMFFNQNDEQVAGKMLREVDPRPPEADRKRVNEPGTRKPEPKFPSHEDHENLEWITYGERRVVIISDSAMAGVRWYGATDALVGADYEL